MMTRLMLSLLSPAGRRARLSVLIFHRVLPQPDALLQGEPDARAFDAILGWVKRWFHVLPLDEAVIRLREGRLPSRAAAITFDDGYQDNYSVALPVLKRHGLSATFFITTRFVDGGCMWNDCIVEAVRGARDQLDLAPMGLPSLQTGSLEEKQQALAALLSRIKYLPHAERLGMAHRIVEAAGVELPRQLMMSPEQVRRMRQEGMIIGAHTVSHPILLGYERDAARGELLDSRNYLQELLGERIALFAYPNGKPGVDYGPDDVALVREAGFDAAFSTAWGAAGQGDDLHQIPRFTPWDQTRRRFGVRMAFNLLQSIRKGAAGYTVPTP